MGAQSKAADYLSRLAELPHHRQATVQMLSATNHDGPTFHTKSRTVQSNATENLTPHPKTDAGTPDITTCWTHQMSHQKHSPMIDYSHYNRCIGQIPFCKHISKCLSNGRAPKHEVDLFLHVKGLLCKHVTDSNKKILALVIPKSWKYTVLVEAHDKHGHQGATCTYSLIKHQYYWKGMNKNIIKYIASCTLCSREKATVQSYTLQMTFYKIATGLVTECETATSGNKHILHHH